MAVSVFYGSDTTCLDDLPLIDTQVTDPRVLIGQRIARRLTTPRGALALINDDPDFGWDVRQYINAKLTEAQKASAARVIQDEVLKDQQVEAATVSFSVSNAGAVYIRLDVAASGGPFSLTLSVSQLTTAAVFDFNQ